MRKLMFLMLVLSGLGFGCGSDGDSKGDNGPTDGDGTTDETTDPVMGDGTSADGETDSEDGDDGIDIPDAGSGGGDPEVKYPECPRDMIPTEYPAYEGTKPFSQADFMACQTECGQNNDCYTEANCPGFDAWFECINNDIVACSAKTGGMCRTQYENFICCASASGCAEDDQACIEGKCGTDLTDVQGCLNADMNCFNSAAGGCFGDDEVAPVDPGEMTRVGFPALLKRIQATPSFSAAR